jgi:choice-of-anchor B domain-containing protein
VIRCFVALLLCVVLIKPALSAPEPFVPTHAMPCIEGLAEGYPCDNVDLAAHLTLAQLGGGSGNDVWGWTDPDTSKEYALMGLNNGTAFVDVSDPEFPIRLGVLPTHSGNSSWRDIKTRGYYAFIVSEATSHGMQVFDLRRLRSVANPPTTFTEDAHYNQFGRAHNIVVNTDSGFAYAVGSRQGTQQCSAGLHAIDIRSPLTPTFAGCFGSDGYTHDAQCVNYLGPDANYIGREICLAANEDTVTIVDVTNKNAPVQISRTTYGGSSYTHQGWLTDDARYFLVNDEIDEIDFGHNTRTYVFDVSDLDAPQLHMSYTAAVAATDHNLYIKGRYAYLSNYLSGLRILDLAQIDGGSITEAAFFDTHPESNAAGTSGAWSIYPYFDSGTVILSDISSGLFVLKPDLCTGPETVIGLSATAAGDQQIALNWAPGEAGASFEVYRSIDGCGGPETQIAQGLTSNSLIDSPVSGGISYGYRVRQRSADLRCVSEFSTCQAAQTTGLCTAPPNFAGISSAQSAGTASCAINLGWPDANARCSGPVTFTVQRSAGTEFNAAQSSTLASGLSGLAFADFSAAHNTAYAYRVQAADAGNGSGDNNPVFLSSSAFGPLSDGQFASGAELGEPILNITGAQRHVGWELVSDVAQSGSRSYYSTYPNSACLAMYSPALTISPGQNASLSFQTRYDFEAGWDAGLVEISTNGGSSWQVITPTGGYPAVMNNSNSADACGFPNSQPAFTGSNLSWNPVSFDLSAYSGTIQLRWSFSTDGNSGGQGWWVDDVVVDHVQVPGLCTSTPETVFANGFE